MSIATNNFYLNYSYPFGMVMPGRTFTSSGAEYRFGFNGMEKDGEAWSGSAGNQLDFGARIYDSRLGRFMSIDPLASSFPNVSNYSFADNTPIIKIDNEGRNPLLAILMFMEVSSVLSMVSDYSIMYSITFQAKAGIIGGGLGAVDQVGVAVDPQGNFGIITTLGAFSHIFDFGFNFNKGDDESGDANDGPAEGGSWMAGFDLSATLDVSVTDYDNVADFSGEASNFSVETPFGSVGVINSQDKMVTNGLTLSVGPGLSAGFGMMDSKSAVFGFNELDLIQMSKALGNATFASANLKARGFTDISASTEYNFFTNDDGKRTMSMSFTVSGVNKSGETVQKVFEVITFVKENDDYVRTGNTITKGQ